MVRDAGTDDRRPRTSRSDLALRLRAISKTFPGVQALRDVDLDVRAGSVHALLGHNGCGKSTLVKTLAGVQRADPGGRAWINGEEFEIGDPEDAERKGLRFVHQELGVISQLSAADNVGLVLGFNRGRFGRIKWQEQANLTVDLMNRFGLSVDPWRPLSEASPPERTAVAVVRALAGWDRGRGVLVLDEPTASFSPHEVDQLFRLIRDISASGTAVILVSHRLDEVMAIADHATVMRDGRVVWGGPLRGVALEDLVRVIADAPQIEREERHSAVSGSWQSADRAPALEVAELRSRYLHGVSLSVRSGEILGIAGLLGSGREELPYILAGDLTSGVTGALEIDGEVLARPSIEACRRHGVGFVPADRAAEGILGELTTRENVTLAGLDAIASAGVLSLKAERRLAREWLQAVNADAGYAERQISTLSGGNQQKAVLARWLSVSPKVMVLSEPTAGVDIGARALIYEELRRRAADGLAIIVASSDVEDLLAACDRVLVLRDGVITAELAGAAMTKSAIIGAMEGVE